MNLDGDHRGGIAPPARGEAKDARTAAMAERLAGADPSRETCLYEPLRRELLARAQRSEAPGVTSVHVPKPRLALWSWATAAALAFAIMLVWPGALTAATQGIETLVQRLVLGRHTMVERHPLVTATPTRRPTPAEPIVIERHGDNLMITTAIGSFTSPASIPGRPDALVYHRDLVEAQAYAPHPLRALPDLPEGYALTEALTTPLYRTVLLYRGPQGDIILLQMPVGNQLERETEAPARSVTLSPGTARSMTTIVEMLTDQPILESAVKGTPAVWVGGRSLMWEEDGVNYVLGGTDLSLDEATRLAESLR